MGNTSETTKWRPATGANGTKGTLKFIRAKELADSGFTGVVVEGEFLKATPNQIDGAKMDYYVALEDGNTAVLNSTGSLAHQMQNVKPGDLIQVVYNGAKAMTSGRLKGKSVHQFIVNIAD